MTNYTYKIGDNDRGNRGIWRETSPGSILPTLVVDEYDVDPEVFRAAAAVLAPDDEVREDLAAIVHRAWMETKTSQDVTSRLSESGEELMVRYADLSEQAKDLDRASVNAVLAALKQHATGGEQ